MRVSERVRVCEREREMVRTRARKRDREEVVEEVVEVSEDAETSSSTESEEGPSREVKTRRRSRRNAYRGVCSSEDETEEEKLEVEVDEEETQSESETESSSSEDNYVNIECFLSSRIGENGRREYLVKHKGVSYLHTTWESEDAIREGIKVHQGLRMRYKKFWEERKKKEWKGEIDPELTTVQRVIGEKRDEFFIKWKGLPYSEATWESADDVKDAPGFQREKEDFRGRKPLPEICGDEECKFGSLKGRGGRRDNRRSFQKYEATPEFLEGGELYGYQLDGLNWLEFSWQTGKHVILGDEMGLGKTVQAIALIASLASRGCSKPHIVVGPLSTLLNWEREFRKWAPHLNVINYSGSATDRKIIFKNEVYTDSRDSKGRMLPLEDRVKCHVILTTYELILLDKAQLAKLRYATLIVDEGHRLKSKSSKLFGSLKLFKCEQRIILTGTPLQNNLEELFMLMHFIDPKQFKEDDIETFLEKYSDINEKNQIEELHRILKPHLLRRMKHDVLKQLPPKKEQIVLVEMSNEQKDVYKALLTSNFKMLSSKVKSRVSGLKSLLMDLRKCCLHPSLITKNYSSLTKKKIDVFTKLSGKLHLLERMLEKLFKGGHRVLIYSQFTTVLDMIEEWLELKGIDSLILDGSVKGKDRQEAVDAFNSEKETYSVFLLSTRAGGLGINLASADTVIIFDSDWNPHNDLQAQARAHRLGQSREVMIYRLVTRASVEERIVEQAKKKMVLEHLVVSKGSKELALKQSELDDIIRFGVSELFGKDTESAKSLASKESEEESEKKESLASKEKKAGREGGNKGKGVYYDDEALDKILDRKLAWEQEEEEIKENQYLQAFKVANFEIQEGNFWEEVLHDSVEEAKVKEGEKMEELGKGKRERKQNFAGIKEESDGEEEGKEEDYAPESSSDSIDSSDDDDDENLLNQINPKKKKKTEEKPVAEVQQQQQQESLDQILSTKGRIMGFSAADRKAFYLNLVKFGQGEMTSSSETETGCDFEQISLRMPHKTKDEIQKYGKVFLEYLKDPEDMEDSQISAWMKEEMRIKGNRDSILQRMADLYLVRQFVCFLSLFLL